MRPGERDGGGYWFTSREKMNEDIANHKYLEYGEYENHLYGTKLDSIRQVMRLRTMLLSFKYYSYDSWWIINEIT